MAKAEVAASPSCKTQSELSYKDNPLYKMDCSIETNKHSRAGSVKRRSSRHHGELCRTPSSGFVLSTIRTVKINDLLSGMGFIYKKPSEWGNKFPQANGESQSPVDINSYMSVYDPGLLRDPLYLNYNMCRETDMCNNGHTVVAYLHYKPGDAAYNSELTSSSTISGGPLPRGHLYELSEFRFHWGRVDTRGSEHLINSTAFPVELHLIHFNTSLFSNIEEALGQPNGIAIIAIFIQVGKEHTGLKLLTDQLEDIQYKGRQKTVTTAFNPVCLLPDDMLRDYWTYTGSLTSPPCSEQVTWIIFRYPLTMSFKQIEEFRRLRTHHKGELPTKGEDGSLVDNYRPTQPLNGRQIRASFEQ